MRDTAAGFGVKFEPWQDGAGRLILSKRADGLYACSIGGVLLSIPRQVGKTFLIGAIVFALCLLNPGLTVLWTAHRLRTADETFSKMQAFARRGKVKPHIAKVVLGAGTQEIKFRNGSRILFGARERGFGRGFDDVDLEVFDEAQILTENAIDDMVPAMNTAANPLAIFVGTPPKPSDPSEFFTNKRKAILAGEDEDAGYVEFSADPGCDPMSRTQWVKANPSYPKRTPESSMLRMLKLLGTESFPREGLGIWTEDDEPQWLVIPEAAWSSTVVPAEVGWLVAPRLAVEVAPDFSEASIVAAGRCTNPDGEEAEGIELVDHRPGIGWLVARVVELQEKHGKSDVVIDKGSPADVVATAALVAAGVDVLHADTEHVVIAAADLILGVGAKSVWHPDADDQGPLTKSVASAVLRNYSDVTLFDRRLGAVVCPVIAASLALWGSRQAVPEEAEPEFLVI